VTKAIHHQKFARRLYREGMYGRAIHHSFRARELAYVAMKTNKGEVRQEFRTLREEETLAKKGQQMMFLMLR